MCACAHVLEERVAKSCQSVLGWGPIENGNQAVPNPPHTPKSPRKSLANLLEGNSFVRVWRHLYLSLPLPPPAPLYKHGVSNKTEPTTRKTLTTLLRRSAAVALKDAVVLAPVLSAPVSFLALAAPITLASSARP